MKYKNKEKYYIYFEKDDFVTKKTYEKLNPKQLSMYEEKCQLITKHKRLFELLVRIDNICRKNSIKYSLADGTLLGAVRHGDFVPWDDDADIMFLREEYKKFIDSCKNESDIVIIRYYFQDKFTTVMDSIDNIYIDLFIIDNIPDSKFLFGCKLKKMRLLRYYLYPKIIYKKKNILYKIFFTLEFILGRIYGSIIGVKKIHRVFDKIADIGNRKSSDSLVRFNASFHEMNYRFNKKWFDEYREIVFRGHTFQIINDAISFLENMYGDYRQLPQEDKRTCIHGVSYFIKNKKYSCIILKS